MSKTDKTLYCSPFTEVIVLHIGSPILSGNAMAGSFASEDMDFGEYSGAGIFLPEE